SGLSIDELGRVLGLSHAGTVRLVDRLVAAGFAVRSKALRDRRAVALMLTEAGETRLSAILQRRNETLSEILSHVSNADRLVLERIAETILAQMSDDAVSALTICRLCDERRCYNCPMDAFGMLESSTHRVDP
ncbi:MarR family winged helix-turn-helix transcriptional regulator, partial [Sphingomonas sp. CCH10-B3]|uniref:MarR family winged helix-turn-helix transcriptional regulator n=1 Tax=Sphingomonas sp. CCH10-B3 TaxID=1768757 RepID=UPI000831E6A9